MEAAWQRRFVLTRERSISRTVSARLPFLVTSEHQRRVSRRITLRCQPPYRFHTRHHRISDRRVVVAVIDHPIQPSLVQLFPVTVVSSCSRVCSLCNFTKPHVLLDLPLVTQFACRISDNTSPSSPLIVQCPPSSILVTIPPMTSSCGWSSHAAKPVFAKFVGKRKRGKGPWRARLRSRARTPERSRKCS